MPGVIEVGLSLETKVFFVGQSWKEELSTFSKVVSWLELTFRIGRVCHAVIYMAEEPDIAVVALGHFVYCVSWLALYNFALRVVIR